MADKPVWYSLGSHGLGDEVLLLPTLALVLGMHVLVLPHREQYLHTNNKFKALDPLKRNELYCHSPSTRT